jgi:hypothetical protein
VGTRIDSSFRWLRPKINTEIAALPTIFPGLPLPASLGRGRSDLTS